MYFISTVYAARCAPVFRSHTDHIYTKSHVLGLIRGRIVACSPRPDLCSLCLTVDATSCESRKPNVNNYHPSGAHVMFGRLSQPHLLYRIWEKTKKTMVTRERVVNRNREGEIQDEGKEDGRRKKKRNTSSVVSVPHTGPVSNRCMCVCVQQVPYVHSWLWPPLVFVATLPSPPFLNEAGRVAASAPAVGGHGVNPAWLPLLVLALLCLWAADGSRRCTRRRRRRRRRGRGGDRKRRYPGVPHTGTAK